ncbi:MAG: gfo/Idh/MocA family oxidoreductase, partial [candidate division Zixibacteria bacterium]|nr:gfo/Idh/MocA family oxidoreductase [candidate division Zixibacteria bacterium]
PTVRTTRDANEITTATDIDAVVIATPVNTHFPLAEAALKAGKHVLLEKPMCASVAECDTLLELAEQKNLTVMVDHTFLYTGAVRKITEMIDSGELGDILYFDSVRVNLGLFQHDVNVIWDLAPHDVSIMDAVIRKQPKQVSAVGLAHFGTTIENIAYVNVTFDEPVIAHFHLNWLAPVKVRTTLIGGTKRMIVYDDTEPSEKIKVYDKGVSIETNVEQIRKNLVEYRIGDMYAPHIASTEALDLVAREFIASITESRVPLTDGVAGRRVVSILEAASQSLTQNGAPVAVA